MALPKAYSSRRITDLSAKKSIDNALGAYETDAADILGIPTNTNIDTSILGVVDSEGRPSSIRMAAAEEIAELRLRDTLAGTEVRLSVGSAVLTSPQLTVEENTGNEAEPTWVQRNRLSLRTSGFEPYWEHRDGWMDSFYFRRASFTLTTGVYETDITSGELHEEKCPVAPSVSPTPYSSWVWAANDALKAPLNGGLYVCLLQAIFEANATGTRQARMTNVGHTAYIADANGTAGAKTTLQCWGPAWFAPNDVVETAPGRLTVSLFQDSGGDLDVEVSLLLLAAPVDR